MTQPYPDGVLAELARLLRPYWPVLLGSIAAGMVGGAAVTALLATINDSLNLEGGGTAFAVLLTFAGLCAVSVVGKIVSDIGTNHVGQHVVALLREELSRKAPARRPGPVGSAAVGRRAGARRRGVRSAPVRHSSPFRAWTWTVHPQP